MTEPLDARILIIEDDRFNIEILSRSVTSMGCSVETAMDGLSGFEAFAKAPPDLVLLDVMLPELDGYEVLERIRTHPEGRHTPVIMVTALQNADARAKALDMGADDYVAKPFRLGELRSRVRSVIETRRMQAEFGL